MRCKQLLGAVAREDFTANAPVFNGEARGEPPTRFHARGESWGPSVDRELTSVLAKHGVLGNRSVADATALMSKLCVPTNATATEAALAGRQPAHRDAPELNAREVARSGRRPIAELSDAEVPLSAMLAIQEDTKLWIFGSCDADAEATAVLLELQVGDVLVWRGDLVHAGAGYRIVHYRLHAYFDPPSDIYQRPRQKDGSLSTERSQCGM